MLTGDLFAVANFLAANYCAERRAERERERERQLALIRYTEAACSPSA